jgi:hypothetical protein
MAMVADVPGQDPADEDARITSLEERIAKAERAEKVRQGTTKQQADDGSRLCRGWWDFGLLSADIPMAPAHFPRSWDRGGVQEHHQIDDDEASRRIGALLS